MGTLKPAPAEAGIIVPEEWSKPYGDYSALGLKGPAIIPYVSTQEGGALEGQSPASVSTRNPPLVGSWLAAFLLSRRAGFRADFPRENSDWTNRQVILLPSPLTGTESVLQHVHTSFWARLREYVSRGGAVFASVSADAAIPEMEDLFGARLVDRVPGGAVALTVISPIGDLKPGDTFRFAAGTEWGAALQVRGGKVIANDQDGRPALVAFTSGAGMTLLSAYPLELYLSAVPSAFEGDERSHQIYQALLDWAGVRPLFKTNQPSVEIGALQGKGRGYAVLANHSSRSVSVLIDTILPIRSLVHLSNSGSRPISMTGRRWNMDLGPYDGAIVEWRE